MRARRSTSGSSARAASASRSSRTEAILAATSAAVGMALVILMVGALFPAVGGSIGKLDLPEGVTELLGGADYGTIAGWMIPIKTKNKLAGCKILTKGN